MLSRIDALEALLREDDGGEKEPFNYNKFIETRNQAEPVETQQEPINLPQLEQEIEAVKTTPAQKSNAIDSDSEDEQVGSQPRRCPANGALDSESEAEEQVQKPHQPVKNTKAPRESRLAAEQGLAKMKRQLDKTIELHIKAKPTLSQFLVGFNELKEEPKLPEGDIYLDSSDDDEPHSASTPEAHVAKPLYFPTDHRNQWLERVNLEQVKQTQQRFLDNTKEFDIDDENQDDDDLEIVDDNAALEPQAEEPELEQSGDEGSEQEVDAGTPVDNTQEDESEAGTPQDTPLDETQPLAATQAAPIDPNQLRELFRKQRRELDDSDSEDEQDDDVNQNIVDHAQADTQDDIRHLTASQQQEELSRRFRQDKEDAYEFFDRQAQESDEEGAIALTDNDQDSGDEDDDGIVENLVDDAKQNIDESEMRAFFQENERTREEELAKTLRKDITGGGWRRRKLLDETGMLSDDEEDGEDKKVAASRLKRAKLMQDSVIGRLASKERTRAFAESMMDELLHRDTLEDTCDSIQESLKFLREEEEHEHAEGPMLSAQSPPPAAEAEEVLPVVAALERPSRERSRASRGSSAGSVSTIYKPLPSVHAAPTLSSKHIPRRARIVEAPKPQAAVQPRKGLGYTSVWR